MPITTTSYSSANDAFEATISELLPLASLDATTREILNYGFTLTRPLARLTPQLPLHVAVARFVWMMAANNRLADIAFYEPKVLGYTDDDLTVPGSSYGMRLRQPQPGLDQVRGVIDRLKDDSNTRRAALTIFHPVDAVRSSNDIPCAFGMMLHARNGRLNATMLMRSNNALTLLPFNIFEFSMLLEVIAVEAGLELGELNYFAGSMHIYENMVERAEARLAQTSISPPPEMPEMPRSDSPLDELTKLGKLDAEIRHGSAGLNKNTVAEMCDKIVGTLSPYWAQIGLLLLSAVAAKKDQATLDHVSRLLAVQYRPFAPRLKPEATAQARPDDIGPLFGATQEERIVQFSRTPLAREFERQADSYEKRIGQPIGAKKLLKAQRFVEERLAARNDTLTAEVFENALKESD